MGSTPRQRGWQSSSPAISFSFFFNIDIFKEDLSCLKPLTNLLPTVSSSSSRP